MTRPIGVLKCGGSLFTLPGLARRLADFFELEPHQAYNWVVLGGGGPFVDAVRTLDSCHTLGEERAHHLAMRALDTSAHALCSVAPNLPMGVADSPEDFQALWQLRKIPVFSPRKWLDQEDLTAARLPHSWQTTSDSIAAHLAARLHAKSLVLAKRAPLPLDATVEQAARLGLVDETFPGVARPLASIVWWRVSATEPGIPSLCLRPLAFATE